MEKKDLKVCLNSAGKIQEKERNHKLPVSENF